MPSRSPLNVSFAPELTAYIATQLACGRHQSAFGVVRASPRPLQRRELLAPASSSASAPTQTGDGGSTDGNRA